MKHLILLMFAAPLFFSGCLVGHKIVYEINVNKDMPGTATVHYVNIRSDAVNDQEFEEDKKNLFEYMLKSDQFIKDRKTEGFEITSRELYLDDSKLNGKVNFNYNKLGDVEGLAYEDGFFFVTMALDDSVLATNGEVIKSATYKRIIWDQSIKPLRFEILIEPTANTKLRPMANLYKP